MPESIQKGTRNSSRKRRKVPFCIESLPQGDEKVTAVRGMFDAIAPRYDVVNRIMTFRLDVRWRKRATARLRSHCAAIIAHACSWPR